MSKKRIQKRIKARRPRLKNWLFDRNLLMYLVIPSFLFVLALSMLGRQETQPKIVAKHPIESLLGKIESGDLPIEPLQVIYSDYHGFHGGIEISVNGEYELSRKSLGVKLAPQSESVTPQSMKHLLQLLLKHQVWLQISSEQPAKVDETRARLTIIYDEQRVELWEWFNEMERNNRLLEIKNFMIGMTSQH
ncbi:hypothetical protein MHM98_01310 [Psychrobium sp. MM17-31]|uniref:hypothetical protein n=1 Tax=Psychrobium sp. MM17-31 TaxID=2917758 RepID=UPI001EF4E666|nr:hypothetical protein [Psychrobium sp. MM17-31]MCG7530000.1 hypothetical protein [Psychrobium sp. MM17-31]